MQNRYVGDVGDFGKYGLLRALCLPEGEHGQALRLGVVWYLTPDETHNNDGRYIGYLDPTPRNLQRFRACDPSLYDKLGGIVKRGTRQVSSIPQRRVLPEDTVYYDRILDLRVKEIHPSSAIRIRARQEWVQDAVQVTKNCDVVFVDPDNGIGSTAQAYSRRGAKYVLLEELTPYLDRGQTLVIYHHLNRCAPAETQVAQRLAELSERFTPNGGVMALRYRRGSARVFLVVNSQDCLDVLRRRILLLLQSPWSEHFTVNSGCSIE